MIVPYTIAEAQADLHISINLNHWNLLMEVSGSPKSHQRCGKSDSPSSEEDFLMTVTRQWRTGRLSIQWLK